MGRTWLDKRLKSPASEVLWQTTWYTVPNTLEIGTAVPLSYLLITVPKMELEKVSLSDMQNVRTVF